VLPLGLRMYYEDHWIRMGMDRLDSDLKLTVLRLLVRLRVPVSVPTLADIAVASTREVRAVVDVWSQFLQATPPDARADHPGHADEERYRLYHLNFTEFLRSRPAIQGGLAHANELIADHFTRRLSSCVRNRPPASATAAR